MTEPLYEIGTPEAFRRLAEILDSSDDPFAEGLAAGYRFRAAEMEADDE